jgi:hypothetical protein
MRKSLSALAGGPWILASEGTALVQRYPKLSKDEVDRLVRLIPRMPMLHLAMIASDDDLAPRLEAFQKDHGHRIQTPVRRLAQALPYALLVFVLGIMIAI